MTLPWTQRQAAKPVDDAWNEIRKVREQRDEINRPRVVFDSGWYTPTPGRPLPPIESFRIPRGQRAAKRNEDADGQR
jgi:hypothetical protein